MLGFLDFLGIIEWGEQLLFTLGFAAVVMIIVYILFICLIKKKE
jgi:hypothetical protein